MVVASDVHSGEAVTSGAKKHTKVFPLELPIVVDKQVCFTQWCVTKIWSCFICKHKWFFVIEYPYKSAKNTQWRRGIWLFLKSFQLRRPLNKPLFYDFFPKTKSLLLSVLFKHRPMCLVNLILVVKIPISIPHLFFHAP